MGDSPHQSTGKGGSTGTGPDRGSRRRRWGRLASSSLVALALFSPAQARDKTDVVTLQSGDVVTGEIKSLQQGQLNLSTDSMATVSIEWLDIRTVESTYYFEMERDDGALVYGTLAAADEPGKLLILSVNGQVLVDWALIVSIRPIEEAWPARWDGSVSLGYSYTKASEVSTFNFGSDGTYRVRKFELALSLDATVTDQPGQDTVSREDFSFIFHRFRKNHWFNEWLGGAQTNSELDLNLRVYLGAAGGRELIKSNSNLLSLAGGLVATREWVGEGDPATNLEATISLVQKYFVYNTPKANISNALVFYPSLSDWGRVRAELNSSLRYEMVKDFFVEFSGYYSYDSRPVSEGATASSDYGVNIGVAWTF